LIVRLRDGDLHATGRFSDTRTQSWEPDPHRWVMHSGRQTEIPSEHWRTGRYHWNADSLDLLEAQYIEIQVPQCMIVEIWPPKLTASDDASDISARRYTTPYLDLMRRAIMELPISASSQPKKETVVAWFREQIIDHRPVSDNFARYLATFVRLPEAQRGGNRRWRMAG
jgi:hypothetical protein